MAPHIHNRARKLRIWDKQLTQRGGVIQVEPHLRTLHKLPTLSAESYADSESQMHHYGSRRPAAACVSQCMQTDPHPDVTHVIVQPGSADAKDLPSALQNAHLVKPEWVSDSLERGKRQPEEQYAVVQGSGAPSCGVAPGWGVRSGPQRCQCWLPACQRSMLQHHTASSSWCGVRLELVSPGLLLAVATDEPPGADDPDAERPGEFWDEVERRWLPLPPFGRWLGHWRREYEGMDHLALVMRVSAAAGIQPSMVVHLCRVQRLWTLTAKRSAQLLVMACSAVPCTLHVQSSWACEASCQQCKPLICRRGSATIAARRLATRRS